ncbi:MAG: hypothetical protein ACNA8O_10010 [Cyanobacteriota bacterium]
MTPTPTGRRRLPSPLLLGPLLLAGLTALGSATVLLGLAPPPAQAQSSLLDAVKRDPSRAKQLCQQLRQLNQQGISYTSKQATRQIASQENLSVMDAEVLTTYVVGLHCPDVR